MKEAVGDGRAGAGSRSHYALGVTQYRILSALLLVAACGGSATSEGPTTPDPEPPPEPWALLEEWGDVEGAREVFTEWQRGERAAEGTVGLMTLAMIEADMERLGELAGQLDVGALEDPRLVTRAALAAGDLRPVAPIALSLGQRACAIAESAPDDEQLRFQAREACAGARLAAAAEGLDVCTAGCDATHELPILLAGNSPVVQASINGSDPTPFILDSGASGTLITRAFAEAHGIEAVEGTTYRVGSPGGLLEASLAHVIVQVGELRVEKVPALILDLPVEFVGGIISPQATWRGLVTELDFRDLVVRVRPDTGDVTGMAQLPLLLTERTPYLQAGIAGRREVPLVLDTGATQTTLFTSWEALDGDPIQRGPETRLAGAGGGGARAWMIPAALEAHAGALDWQVIQPMVAERGDGESIHGEVRYRGLVGMDLMMGRKVQLDLPGRAIRVSDRQVLADWDEGDIATYRIRAAAWDDDVVLTERVMQRQTDPSGVEAVMIEVTFEGEHEGNFRYAMPDLWPTRGTWLVSRPAALMWEVGSDGSMTQVPPQEAARRWLPIFVPFQPRPQGNPTIRFVPVEREGQEPLSCTEMVMPAATEVDADATLEMVECPSEPWRTRRLTVRGSDDTILYEFTVTNGAPGADDDEDADEEDEEEDED